MEADHHHNNPPLINLFAPKTPSKTQLHYSAADNSVVITDGSGSGSGFGSNTRTATAEFNSRQDQCSNSSPGVNFDVMNTSEGEFSQAWGFGNVFLDGTAPSWPTPTTSSTLLGGQVTPPYSGGAGYVADATAAAAGSDNLPQPQPRAIPENENDDGTTPRQKNKKQKVGSSSKKQPGEKRKFKYYWAKIDVAKPNTPKPKTPKPKTPKPAKAKIPKSPKPKAPKSSHIKAPKAGAKKVECSEICELVLKEPAMDSNCKKSLNFEDTMLPSLNLEFSPSNIVPERVAELVTGEGGETINVVKPKTKIKENKMIVYRRRLNGKCLHKCRKLGPNLDEKFKKKRLQRKKISFGSLQKFEGFDHISLEETLFHQILSVKGKLRMLLPSQVDLSQEGYICVLSLLSSKMIFTKKRRSKKKLPSPIPPILDQVKDEKLVTTSPIVEPDDNPVKDNMIGEMGEKCFIGQQTSNLSPNLLEYEVAGNKVESCREQLQGRTDVDLATLSPSMLEGFSTETMVMSPSTLEGLSTEIVVTKKSAKVKNASKVKSEKSPKKKRKAKDGDYLPKLSDDDVEQLLDKYVEQLRVLKIEDDPRTWSIALQDDENEGLHEKIKLEKERAILYKKIGIFLQAMHFYQGSKEFIQWNGSVLDSVVGVFLTQNVSDVLSSNAYLELASRYPIKEQTIISDELDGEDSETTTISSQGSSGEQGTVSSNSERVIVEHPDDEDENESTTTDPIPEEFEAPEPRNSEDEEYDAALREMLASLPDLKDIKQKGKYEEDVKNVDWEKIRVMFLPKSKRTPETQDSVDWDAVRNAPVLDIADAIRHRGQHRIIAAKIQRALNRLINDHGTLDLEWLRVAPPQVAKAYLLSFYGLGLKSVECLRLLTLRHHGFPVDVNIARASIRLGWVPIKPLPAGMPFHLLQKYPLENEIQKYLWPRLCHLKKETLYLLHYQMITFGKVFCLKRSPNCGACPFKSECQYFESMIESRKLSLEGKKSKKKVNPFDRIIRRLPSTMPYLTSNITSSPKEVCASSLDIYSSSQLWASADGSSQKVEYFVEEPSTPEVEEEEKIRNATQKIRNATQEVELVDIEDSWGERMFHLNLSSSTSPNVGTWSDLYGEEEKDLASTAMVSLSQSDGYKPLPKQIQTSRLRTEHQVYELPREHPLLEHLCLERQIGDVPYLLAIWATDKIKKTADTQDGCLGCEKVEDDCSTVLGTILTPISTALRKFFPLNATYFQMNEVFADFETSERPIKVPTRWIWSLKKRTLYCGTGTTSVVKGWGEMDIRQCCWEGYVCVRGFNRQTRGPTALSTRFHERTHGKAKEDV